MYRHRYETTTPRADHARRTVYQLTETDPSTCGYAVDGQGFRSVTISAEGLTCGVCGNRRGPGQHCYLLEYCTGCAVDSDRPCSQERRPWLTSDMIPLPVLNLIPPEPISEEAARAPRDTAWLDWPVR